ncbi:preprotein translocase subunit [Plasmopara halstedii]|uniref:Preprotein translocase subunit n=1 Tax=Plasmopara halstedii TaxID=4781 RepID=A0A0P1AI95_PLAHL|nr:preprotein translocase subunit [Plasmopara halstedii]CEG40617.1 preprotein translocase subunit [Plasmopara halstedii]|eukprot:XP_024576986.1 preprotein translocase subunit [Plasmopara halstedii]
MSQKLVSTSTQDAHLELFDFDCNLTHEDLRGNINELIKQATAVGVKEMLVPGATIEESLRAIELCRHYRAKLFPTAGVHPYYAREMPTHEKLATLRGLVELDEVQAVGECGLDYSPDFPQPEVQKKWFVEQLRMACALRKPLFLHERLAHDDFIRLIDEAKADFNGYFPPAAVHCFTGSEKELKVYIARGVDWYIGITGFICKKQGAALKDLVKLVPLNRLVLETDAPYMGFPNCRRAESFSHKKQYPNVPSAMPFVAEAVASALGRSTQDIAFITRANARRFLRL